MLLLYRRTSSTHLNFLWMSITASSYRFVYASDADECPIGVRRYLYLPHWVINVVSGLLSDAKGT